MIVWRPTSIDNLASEEVNCEQFFVVKMYKKIKGYGNEVIVILRGASVKRDIEQVPIV